QLPRKEEVRLCRGDGTLELLQVLRLVAARPIEVGERRVHDSLGLGKGAPPGKSFCSRSGPRITGPQATTWIVWPTVEDGDGPSPLCRFSSFRAIDKPLQSAKLQRDDDDRNLRDAEDGVRGIVMQGLRGR